MHKRRRYVSHLLRKRWWQIGGVVFAVLLMAIVPLLISPDSRSPYGTGEQKYAANLRVERKLYGVTERPRLHLRLSAQKTSVLSQWLAKKAYAAELPLVEVRYDTELISMPVDVDESAEGGYDITLQPQSRPKPGKYDVSVSLQTASGKIAATQTFAWGVLAVNTSKSAYVPGETARLAFAVLDSNGHTICDAPLLAALTQPDGSRKSLSVIPSGDCKGDTYTALPDYTATTQILEQYGEYEVTVRLADSQYEQSTTFTVAQTRPYDIERIMPTRLYPPAEYGVVLRVTPTQSFTGEVSDRLPSGFSVRAPAGARVTSAQDGSKLISWDATWQAGQTYLLEYSFTAPPVSPAFYEAGPLYIGGTAAEKRTWQIAGDATITFVNSTAIGPITSDANGDTTGSVTTTAGNTLVLIFGENVSNNSGAIVSISDSAGNSWTYSTNASNSNPPVAYISGTTSVNAIAYVTNASAVTSITVRAKAAVPTSFWVLEFGGIKTATPVISSEWVANATASTSHNSASIAIPLCDAPTTDQMLRGGNYFCADDSALIVTSIMAGAQTSTGITLNTSGFTQLGNLCVAASCSGTIVRLGAGYAITSTSSSAMSSNWTIGVSRAAALCIIAFRPDQTSSLERKYFWAS